MILGEPRMPIPVPPADLTTLLDRIRVDRSHYGPALKKPLLLLLLCSLIERNPSAPNHFEFGAIREELDRLIRQYGGKTGTGEA